MQKGLSPQPRSPSIPSLLLQAHIFVVVIPCDPSFYAGANEAATTQQPRGGDSVSHDITELQIGSSLKMTLISILLRTFGGE